MQKYRTVPNVTFSGVQLTFGVDSCHDADKFHAECRPRKKTLLQSFLCNFGASLDYSPIPWGSEYDAI
jgi:hypothetical protein